MASDASNILQILYISTLSVDVADIDFQQLLESSRRNNAINDITGVMCVAEMHFIQILEGPENKLIKLYSKILDDARHHDCILLGISHIHEKSFKDWSMGYIKNPDAKIILNKNELLKYRDRTRAQELVKIMRQIISLLK